MSSGAKDMPLEEKQRLAGVINAMSTSSLAGVVHILMKHMPELKVCMVVRGSECSSVAW
jgi:hypothetical protein